MRNRSNTAPRHPREMEQGSTSIYDRHYRRNDDYGDPRQRRESGRPNHPNYGREVYEEGPPLQHDYGYNQGRNAASNIGGRAYGQSYGQYFQGSDRREWSNPRDYQGEYDPDGYYDDARFDDRYEAEYDDDDHIDRYAEQYYPHDGYQGFGYTEGFGHRGGHRNERDWLHADDYRRGHAQRHRGYGKYGSR